MASKKKSKTRGLRVHTERKDSTSYLLTPELSMTSSPPTQFSLTGSYPDPGTTQRRYPDAENLENSENRAHRNTYVSIADSGMGSLAPLLPDRQRANDNRNPVRLPDRDRIPVGLPDRDRIPVGLPDRTELLDRDRLADQLLDNRTRVLQWDDNNLAMVQSNFMYGVGDLEQIHIDGSHAKTYDYADYGHQYEELPNRRSIAKCAMDSGIDSRSELYQSSGGATDIASEAGDMANIVNHNEKRKRVNPLYDANMTQSMPSIYNKTKTGNDKSLLRQVRCLKCGLIILLVVSIASLAISLFAVINYIQTKDEIDPVLAPRVDALHDNYIRLQQLLSSFDDNNDTMKVLSELIKKVNVIKTNASTQAGEIDQLWQQAYTQSQHINKNANNILASRDNMTNMIASLNLTLQLQLHNISKQEGPTGPQGVANFTRCRMLNISNDAVASEVFSSYTRWSPLEIELESHIAIFSMCSVDGGVDSRLKIQTLGAQEDLQYQCECSGVINGKSRRICYIHQLICPRVS